MAYIEYSFIIPHHNSPDLLNRCLDSIPHREDIEIIVVDDNSDEGKKPSVLRPDVQIIYITSQDSKGAGRARNYGLRMAKGKWLLFADCDDFYEEGFINVLDKYRCSDNEMLCFDIFYAYDIERQTEKWTNRYSKAVNTYLSAPTEKNLRTVKHIIQGPWNFMVKRKIVMENDIWFEEIPKGNDAYFHHMSSLLCTNVLVIPDKLYYWVWNSNSITHKSVIKNKATLYANMHNTFERIRRITELRIKARAWDTIIPFLRGSIILAKNYGILTAVNYKLHYLFCGIPWLKIWWHKLWG